MSYPIEHLSASSLSLHMRCPRQWADKYLHGNRGPSNASLTIGSAAHLALARLNNQEPLGDPWQDTLNEQEQAIEWGKLSPETAKGIYEAHVYHYWEQIGKFLAPGGAEKTHLFNVEGVELPVMAIIDKETDDRLIDYKTTAYFNRKSVRPNKEWKFQQGIYQLVVPKPSEVHVLTRAKTDPVVVPSSTADPLHFGMLDRDKTIKMIQDEWNRIKWHLEFYGIENIWPGNPMHDWAAKYCPLGGNCCGL